MAFRRDYHELTVITKTYDLILWSCHHTSKFPRNHRFVETSCLERAPCSSAAVSPSVAPRRRSRGSVTGCAAGLQPAIS
jgi:hypothetical protein